MHEFSALVKKLGAIFCMDGTVDKDRINLGTIGSNLAAKHHSVYAYNTFKLCKDLPSIQI